MIALTSHRFRETCAIEPATATRRARTTRHSVKQRRIREPWPLTREEADEKFRPSPQTAGELANGPRLYLLNKLTARLTNEQAHQLILDAVYGARPASERPAA